jgi:hypothetical protein
MKQGAGYLQREAGIFLLPTQFKLGLPGRLKNCILQDQFWNGRLFLQAP